MQTNDFIKVVYLAKIKETGQEFDKTGDKSAPVILKPGFIIKGLEEALLEMNVNEKKTVEIPPEKAFGIRDPKLVRLVPLTEFRKHNTKPQPGMFIQADNMRGRVLSVSGGRVRVDFNNPFPVSYGTFTKVLGEIARDRSVISQEEAVRKTVEHMVL